MRKFIRQKANGFVLGFNETLASSNDFEVFETAISPLPEYIEDLSSFLEPEKKAKKAKKSLDEGEGA